MKILTAAKTCSACASTFIYDRKPGGVPCYCSDDCRGVGRMRATARYEQSDKYAASLTRSNKSTRARLAKTAWAAKHPHAIRGSKLISDSTRNFMLLNQGFMCAIATCCKPIDLSTLKVDHDHLTNKVRGLLCGSCNLKMSAVDDSKFLKGALAYKAMCDSEGNGKS